MSNAITPTRHLVIINHAFEPDLTDPEQLLERYFMLSGWAEAISQLDIEVTVFQRFSHNTRRKKHQVNYIFVKDQLPPCPACYHCTLSFNRKISAFLHQRHKQQLAVHINGLIFSLSVLPLIYNTPKSIRWFIQHHAEQPHSRAMNFLNRRLKNHINGYFFTTKSHALPWIEQQALYQRQVIPLMECSSACKPQDKSSAKQVLKQNAHPLILWTANLNHNKDPLTILRGFESFARKQPNAKLLMLYQSTELLAKIQETIDNSTILSQSVELIGKINYQDIAVYYSAADIFVQGSSTEGSGIAVLDALCCGAIPVITAIPSFVALTENGKVGVLWQSQQKTAQQKIENLATALEQVMQQDLKKQQKQCQQLFQQRWSFEQLAKEAVRYYWHTSSHHTGCFLMLNKPRNS